MKMPYLGRIDLFWCTGCNVPLLSNNCTACGEDAKKVQITPPGDVRPAFEKDVGVINETVEKQFGSPLIKGKRIVLLNSVPGFDRFDEIILDGEVVGALRFDVEKLRHEFMPRIAGAQRIWGKASKSFVSVAEDAAEYIKGGSSVLMPGVVDFDRDIQKGQEVLVTCGEKVIAVGKSRFSGNKAAKLKKGMFVKIRKHLKNGAHCKALKSGQDWGKVLESNRELLKRYEKEALAFIKKTVDSHNFPVVVSFSGGKDSLATLLLVKDVVEGPKVIFIDTGLEFPETHDYVREITKRLNLELITAGAGDRFWNGLEVFGMSGRDYRWCCKVCKLGPVAKIMDEKFPDGVLNFIGQRRYESEVRARSGRVWRNSWLPRQLAASPIQNWNALHIWLYLMDKGTEVNPLYLQGFERIGCWVCPSSSLSEINLIQEMHPDLWMRFEKRLRANGFTEDEFNYGFWRWRELPKGQKELKKTLNISSGKREIVGRVSTDLKRAGNMASSLNRSVSDDIAMRSTLCLGCGVCLAHCEFQAIEFREGKIWMNSNCSGCKKCHLRCPIVKYLYKDNYN
jgi:phosphoadenosine phosphosulfate reductase